jgi:uncharacterized protein
MITVGPHGRGSILAVRAKPGARVNAVLDVRGGALRVAVTAPPERGQANAAIIALLADALGCKGSQISLLAGRTSRDKRFLVLGLAPDEIRSRLRTALGTDV